MIEMHSKYDNMHTNGMFYALICINNHVLSCLDCMLSYVEQPTGFVSTGNKHKVFKLEKSVYGLHLVPRAGTRSWTTRCCR